MTKLFVGTSDHPFWEQVENGLNIEQDALPQGSFDLVFDLTVSATEKKEEFLQKIFEKYQCPVITDLTLCHGKILLQKYPFIQGALGAAFYSPKDKYEFWTTRHEKLIQETFNTMGFTGEKVDSPGFGFIYPRTIVQILNEAFYSQDIATQEDIDRAMQFGVNYPLGPFEWAKKIGERKVATLLNELFLQSGEARYQLAPSLKEYL